VAFSKDKPTSLLFDSIAYGTFLNLAYPITNGALNPAISIAICLTNSFAGYQDSIKESWVYLTMPILGSIIAVIFYEFVYVKLTVKVAEKKQKDDQKTLTQQFYDANETLMM